MVKRNDQNKKEDSSNVQANVLEAEKKRLGRKLKKRPNRPPAPKKKKSPTPEDYTLRISKEESKQGVLGISSNVVDNLEFLSENLAIKWVEICYLGGLRSSSMYQIRNKKKSVGTTTAVRIAKALGFEPWAIYMPLERFKEYYLTERSKSIAR
jgi:hypothetical protein